MKIFSNLIKLKFAGKEDEKQMLPYNDSISTTIDALVATTSFTCLTATQHPHDTVTVNNRVCLEKRMPLNRLYHDFRSNRARTALATPKYLTAYECI